MYLQTSRLQYNLQKVGVFQTAHSNKNIQVKTCKVIIAQKPPIFKLLKAHRFLFVAQK